MARHGTRSNRQRHSRRPGGFTLIELLVVISIIILVSAVTLPTLIPALQNRQVNEGARILQGALAGARDAAIRANAPRGIRLLSDPVLNGSGIAACNRILTIETAPDHSDGLVMLPGQPIKTMSGAMFSPLQWGFGAGLNALNTPSYPFPLSSGGDGVYPPYSPLLTPNANGKPYGVLMVMQSVFTSTPVYSSSPVPSVSWTSAPIPATPTNWFWNIRIGDKIRFNDAGAYYTVIGPMTVTNPELFVNDGNPGGATIPGMGNPSSTLRVTYPGWPSGQVTVQPEYLLLVNGIDDNNNGYVDEGFDGLDENLDGVVDGINEFTLGVTTDSSGLPVPEPEAWLGTQLQQASAAVPPAVPYTIVRRPVPTQGAREVSLPAACVVDLTTWNLATQERSRLPVDSLTGTVDILLNQRGQVVPTTVYSSPSAFPMDSAFFHFWVADRTDVFAPTNDDNGNATYPTLPMPQGTPGYPPVNHSQLLNKFLKRERQLVTLYTRTGQVVTNSIENFDATVTGGPNVPYHDAQLGIREAK